MKKEIAKKWMDALRSGEYKQTTECLRDENGFCCLGVLCDLHSKEFDNPWNLDDNGDKTYLNFWSVLPHQVMEWAGIKDNSAKITGVDWRETNLAFANDELKMNFDGIADLIEKHLEEL